MCGFKVTLKALSGYAWIGCVFTSHSLLASKHSMDTDTKLKLVMWTLTLVV